MESAARGVGERRRGDGEKEAAKSYSSPSRPSCRRSPCCRRTSCPCPRIGRWRTRTGPTGSALGGRQSGVRHGGDDGRRTRRAVPFERSPNRERGNVASGARVGDGRCAPNCSLTFALVLVGAVLAVDLAVAPEAQVDALATVALELALRANGAVLLVAVVVALGVAVAAPRLRDAVHFSRTARELLGGTRGGV